MRLCYKRIIGEHRASLKYSGVLLFIIFIGLLVNILLVYHNSNRSARLTLDTLMTYDKKIDINKYCHSVNAKYMFKLQHNTKKGYLLNLDNYKVKFYKVHPKYIISDYDIYLPLHIHRYYFYLPIFQKNLYIILFNLIGFITMFIIVTLVVDSILLTERKGFLSSINNKEEYLRKDIITNIALNVNHELNSPLLVIKSLLDDMKYILSNDIHMDDACLKTCFHNTSSRLAELKDDVLDAEIALDNVYGVIRPIGNFKRVENSNGNKNISMLLESSINIAKIRTDYTLADIIIDKELDKYSVYHDNGLTNGAFSNIIINHIKNSIDAHSTRLEFKLSNKDEKYLCISIIDNGDGIPNYIKNKIFNINITTKSDVSKYERGVGMYINKMILEKYDGSDRLVWTKVNTGTIFEIKIRYVKFKYYEKKEL